MSDAQTILVIRRVAAALVCLVWLAGCGKPDPATERRRKRAPRAHLTYQIGMQVDDLGLADTEGTSHSIESYRGRLLVLEFWGCRSEAMRRTESARRRLVDGYGPRGVAYLAVNSNFDEYPQEMRECLRDRGSSYTVLVDYGSDARVRLGARRNPHAVVLDRGGVLRFTGCPFSPGQLDLNEAERADWLEEALDTLLDGRSPDPAVRPAAGDRIRHLRGW